MKQLLTIIAIACLAIPADAAHRRTNCNGTILKERGHRHELSHRATTFNGVTRYGRSLGGGPRGFAAPSGGGE